MNQQNYYSMGIDAHKRFCQVHVLDQSGETAWKGRINSEDYGAFTDIVRSLDLPCKAVFESSANWHVLYDLLCAIKGMEEVMMAHPLKVKMICAAHLKNDKVDAHRLAMLLRLDMVPCAHATGPEARSTKELVRQRASWVGMQTRIRNRTHRLLGAVPDHVELPQCSDIFGTKGMNAMRKLTLPAPFQDNLDQNLAMLGCLKEQTKGIEKELQRLCKDNADIALLVSIPGIGKVLACVIGAEVDGIDRFASKKKFIGYCGLAPTTTGSAGIFHQGRMIKACNKWLKWAFIEAAWVAIGCDGYFGSLYKSQRARGKKANNSITIVARRMAQISWEMLHGQRPYEKRPATKPNKFPARSYHGLVDGAA